MAIDSVRKSLLLKQIKRGKQTGALLWTRLFVLLGAAAELVFVISAVHSGERQSWACCRCRRYDFPCSGRRDGARHSRDERALRSSA